MTDPTGRSFLSYRRSRSYEAKLLIDAQHDLGIPTWQDISELNEEPTEAGIRKALSDSATSNAVLWVTPEVAESSMIRKVEVPLIVERFRRQDGFFVVPVSAGGLGYNEAAAAVSGYIGNEDLKTWNIRKVHSDPINPDEARRIAERVLLRRLENIHTSLAEGVPLRLVLHTRTAPAIQPGCALVVDWTHRFEGREATSHIWNSHLLPALELIANAIQQKAPGRQIEASGLLSIPAAIAFGHAFSALRKLDVAWEQFTLGRLSQMWTLASTSVDSEFEGHFVDGSIESQDLGILVSVNADVSDAVSASVDYLPTFRAYVHVGRKGDSARTVIETPAEAANLARLVVSEIRQAKIKYHISGRVHLFMAVPVGLAMLIGQLLNTLGEVQTYEHIQVGATGHYHPAALLSS